ncbi:META domain-containing protein [Halomonas sp. 7T]|uniref:META domain-containing protein n=1 Tax=Halomonas sp. 7T TaxID=2893469 RepID=UPI0021D8EB3E|nr:META domain-containing protein [Halomonas sp. 7T]UXZ55090.1 META domain-containing protein [Halomonas sp. 7T]
MKLTHKLSLAALLLGTVALTGCATQDATVNDEPLENTYWKLLSVGEHAAVTTDQASEAHLVLHTEESRLAGSTGCNRLMGQYERDDDRLSFGQLATTRMACPSEAMMQEQHVLEALNETARWQIEGKTLTLIDTENAARARFEAVHLY